MKTKLPTRKLSYEQAVRFFGKGIEVFKWSTINEVGKWRPITDESEIVRGEKFRVIDHRTEYVMEMPDQLADYPSQITMLDNEDPEECCRYWDAENFFSWFQSGKESVTAPNCCCRFDEAGEEIISLCAVHAEYYKKWKEEN